MDPMIDNSIYCYMYQSDQLEDLVIMNLLISYQILNMMIMIKMAIVLIFTFLIISLVFWV